MTKTFNIQPVTFNVNPDYLFTKRNIRWHTGFELAIRVADRKLHRKNRAASALGSLHIAGGELGLIGDARDGGTEGYIGERIDCHGDLIAQ